MTEREKVGRPVLLRCQHCHSLNRIDLARLHQHPKCANCPTVFSLERPQPVTDDDFAKVIDGASVPVLVDFYADWCGPCRALAPIVEDLAKEYSGRLKVGTVDIDHAQDVARQFQIMSVPTIIFFKGGSVVDKVTGLRPRADLKKRIDAVLS